MLRGRCCRVLFALSVLVALHAQQPTAPPQPPTLSQLRLVGRIVSVVHDGIPAAEVWATDAAGTVLGRTVADGDGYYQLPRLPNGTLRLHAKAQGQVPGQIEVEAHGRTAAVTLPLEDGRPLSGTVLAADGKPVVGIPVIVVPSPELKPPFAWCGEVITDQDGTWSLPAVPMRRLQVRAFAPGHALTEVAVERDATTVSLRLIADATPPRRVQLTNWRAGSRGVVRIEMPPDNWQRVFRLPRNLGEAEVAADGTAQLWTLARPHEVRLSVPGYRTMPICVHCAERASKDLEFELIPREPDDVAPSTGLHGLVQDELGRPLPGITVLGRSHGVYAEPVRSAADGTFQLRMPARAGVLGEFSVHSDEWCIGDLRASLEIDGRSWLRVKTDPAQSIVLHAIRSGAVGGVLLGPKGTPLAAANVRLQGKRGDGQWPTITAATDPAGRLLVSGLPPGAYVLTAVGAGLLPASVGVVVPPGGTVEPDRLTFAPVSEIRGVVLDGAGARVGGALLGAGVSHRDIPAALRRQLLSAETGTVVLADRSGRFRLPGIAAGKWWIVGREESDVGAALGDAQQVALGEGELVELEVRR